MITVKSLISDKRFQSSRITLIYKKEQDKTEKKKKIGHSSNEIISDDLYEANTLNKYFQNTVTKLGITECPDNFSTNATALGYPV